ncbi:LysR family transcriptional regulator [Photobacterium rosenbergii]|uniref:LysR family transcriptional regulator n=1 Tax=Photobacterium rosenbergii TaxID=294936 RepID=UPI001C9958C4|nr:LysR family transcriptional regulator [Photobacterium rosenbergii]MBY5945637.1 LysR family transcriptional regulator [Photobacterium rosenbergii]
MISPNIEHLYYFTTVVETGSFTAAGRKLGRDRSSIGQAIANLEVDLGVKLFHRNGRNLTLTEEGENLYGRARTLVQNYQSFCQLSQNVAHHIESSLVIGVDFLTTVEEIAHIDQALSDQFPGLNVQWQNHPTNNLDSLLEQGQVDIAIRLYQNRDLPEDFHPKHIDNVTMSSVINCEASSTLATSKMSTVRLHSELRKISLVSYPDLNIVLRTDRFELVQQTFSPSSALAIIRQKPSWGIFPQKLLSEQDSTYRIFNIDTDAPLYARRIAIWHHNQSFGKAKQWLISELATLLSKE